MRFSVHDLRLDDAAFSLKRTPHRLKPYALHHQQSGRKHRVGHVYVSDDGWREVVVKDVSLLACPPGTPDATVLAQLAALLRTARKQQRTSNVPTRRAHTVNIALERLTYPR